MLAIDVLEWPGMNQAFLVSFGLTLLLVLVAVLYGRRRPVDRPLSWGGAMFGATYAIGVMLLAYGVVPHQWLTHVQNELGWRADKKLMGPGDIFKAQSQGGSFPFEISYLQVGDAIVTLIYAFFIGLQLLVWSWWQKRGRVKPAAEVPVPVSAYGRPLVRKV